MAGKRKELPAAKRRSLMSSGLVSDQLRIAIEDSGMTGQQIAEKLGVEGATISNFLNRKRGLRLDTVDDLCRLLNLRIQHGRKK